jgi:hypothetical protein
MDRLGVAVLGCSDNGLDIKIALLWWSLTDTNRLIGHLHVQGVAIDGGIYGYGFNSHFAAGVDNSDSDFAAIGY